MNSRRRQLDMMFLLKKKKKRLSDNGILAISRQSENSFCGRATRRLSEASELKAEQSCCSARKVINFKST